MDNTAFHFAEPMALLLLLLLPLWWWRSSKSAIGNEKSGIWRRYADKHLLPYLMLADAKADSGKQKSNKIRPVLQALAWLLLVVALAGPRWEFTRSEIYEPDACIMVVMDISRSMLVEDVAPSRMARARAAVSELLTAAKGSGARVGLIAFAAQPYIISPLSEDMEIIKQLLPSVTPDLAGIQGSDPVDALELAARQLQQQSELLGLNNTHIYFITDGDLEDTADDLVDWATKMAASDNPISIHTMLIASDEGGAVPDIGGSFIDDARGAAHISKPDEELIKRITSPNAVFARAGTEDVGALIDIIKKSAKNRKSEKNGELVWHERFLPFLLAGMVFILLRSPLLLALLVFVSASAHAADEVPLRDDLAGLVYFNKGQYERASDMLEDPYRRGVALYRAGKYADAIASFANSTSNPSIYDMGNSYFQERNYQDAAASYRKVLETDPDNEDAKHNLKLAEEMMKNKSGGGGGGGENQQQNQNEQGKSQSENKEQSEQQQQPQSKSEAELDRMLREIQGDPGELLKKRVEQQDREAIKGKYVSKLSPW